MITDVVEDKMLMMMTKRRRAADRKVDMMVKKGVLN